jgi:protein TonB
MARSGSGAGDSPSSRAPGNSSSGLGGSGSGLAVVGPGDGAGDPGAAYAAYLGRLRQRVYEALRYPATARRRGLTGTVILELTVRPDGAIGRVVVVDSSSHAALDQAAVDSVRSLRPQPFPADLPSRTLHVRLPVVFELQ